MALTSSNLNFFLLPLDREGNFQQNPCIIFHLKYVTKLPLGIKKFKFGANLEEKAN